MKRSLSMISVAALVMAFAAACSSAAPTGQHGRTAAVRPGGVLRVGLSSLGFSGNLDPSDEYTENGWGLLFAIGRQLVAYKYAPGTAGLQIVPDLATSVPAPTDHGLTYTFHLRSGIKFGPPLNREITSSDIAFAFERLNMKAVAAQYGFYFFGLIRGMTGTASRPEPISGIQTPNPSTIVFHLTKPIGDFINRLALPETAPIPPSVGKCFTSSGSYGRDIIASGAYMIQGEQNLNPSSCATIKPLSGYTPDTGVTLVRNPNYNPATDPNTGRKNYPNAIVLTVDSNVSDIFDKIQAGSLDTSYYDEPPKTTLRSYLTNPALRAHLESDLLGFVNFFQMNLEVPPFTDVHVRRAVSDIINKAAVEGAWGGSIAAEPASAVIPPYILGNGPGSNFNAYPTAGNSGSLAKAEAEMKLSKYDPKHDGKCDVAVCKNIVFLDYNVTPWTDVEPIIVQDLGEIGIQLVPREMEGGTAFSTVQTPHNLIPTYMGDWTYDYPDPYTYIVPLFDSKSIAAAGNQDNSMVGLTPSLAKQLHIPYPSGGIPSIDNRVSACEVLSGAARTTCWIDVQEYFMKNVVSWVPLLWQKTLTITGSDVTNFQITPEIGVVLQNMAVSNHLKAPS